MSVNFSTITPMSQSTISRVPTYSNQASAQVASTPIESEQPKKNNHWFLKTLAALAVVTTAVALLRGKVDVFKNFGFQSGRNTDKFTNFSEVKRSPNGVLYIIKDTNAYMSAYVQQEIDLGTHIMFLAQLVEAEILSNKPTVTYDYYQKNIKPKPEPSEKKGWRCKICGFVYEEEILPADYICPICKHGAVDFEKI